MDWKFPPLTLALSPLRGEGIAAVRPCLMAFQGSAKPGQKECAVLRNGWNDCSLSPQRAEGRGEGWQVPLASEMSLLEIGRTCL
jgi:hypothetical protein